MESAEASADWQHGRDHAQQKASGWKGSTKGLELLSEQRQNPQGAGTWGLRAATGPSPHRSGGHAARGGSQPGGVAANKTGAAEASRGRGEPQDEPPVPRCTREGGRARRRYPLLQHRPQFTPLCVTRGRGATTGWAWQWSEALYAAGSSRLLDLRAVAASERNHPGGGRGGRGEGEEPRRGRKKRKASACRRAPIVPRRPGHVAPLSTAPHLRHFTRTQSPGTMGKGVSGGAGLGREVGNSRSRTVAGAPFPSVGLRFISARVATSGVLRGWPRGRPLAGGAGAAGPSNVRGRPPPPAGRKSRAEGVAEPGASSRRLKLPGSSLRSCLPDEGASRPQSLGLVLSGDLAELWRERGCSPGSWEYFRLLLRHKSVGGGWGGRGRRGAISDN